MLVLIIPNTTRLILIVCVPKGCYLLMRMHRRRIARLVVPVCLAGNMARAMASIRWVLRHVDK